MCQEFEWDEVKAETNWQKHRISFEEAETVFSDDFARIIPDIDHSIEENRFLIMGYSNQNRLLVVSFCE